MIKVPGKGKPCIPEGLTSAEIMVTLIFTKKERRKNS